MNVLVMYDHQTRTLWSQFLGRGVKGTLAGAKLDVIPVTQTTWGLWKELHPDTLALDKRGRYERDSYRSYYVDDSAGVLGEFRSDSRLERKELVLGLALDGHTKAYPFRVLETRAIVNDTVAEQGVAVFFDKSTGTAIVYGRSVDGRELTFRIEEGDATGARTILVDNETHSRWMALTGAAIEGELKGKVLGRVQSHLSVGNQHKWDRLGPEKIIIMKSCVGAP